ncbi:MAG: SDR family NAD(P)-dependent oxidoreductase [Campylobacteraceae bacterium]
MKVVLITGASRGLGKNMALHLSKKGYHILFTYKSSQNEAKITQKEIEKNGVKAAFLQLDTSDIKNFESFSLHVKDILEKEFKIDKLYALINNAGIGVYAPFESASEEDFDKAFNTNVKGVFFLTQKLLPCIQNGGKILNVSSGLARFTLPNYSAYAATKGAIEVLTRYMAKELASRQIRVNVIAPGAIETDFGGGAVRDNKDVNSFIASVVALGRAGLPDDIGSAVSAIISDDFNWVTGERIEVSGGMCL